jgi:23S rRNA (cytosine1962-C5)-methyltransferase
MPPHDVTRSRKARRNDPLSAQRSGPPGSSQADADLLLPTVILSRRAAERLRAGHVWVYSSDVEGVIPGPGSTEEDLGGVVAVADSRRVPFGTALYSPASQITLRLLTSEVLTDRSQWLELLRQRLGDAIERRREMLYAQHGRSDACRLVFSEADELPGLVIDKYAGIVILQLLARGMDHGDVRAAIVDVLRTALAPAVVVERPDPRIHELEGISVSDDPVLFAGDPTNPLTATIFQLNGLRFHYDASAGQKTGAFLDQRENYDAAARHAFGAALDICTYQGGFALHLAQSCANVTGVDASRAALEVAEKNLELNREMLGEVPVDWIEANAFDLLHDWSAAGPAWDTIVLDPPAFAKSKRAAEGALRGYKELNLRALKLLRPGGTLVTCSCSHHVSLADFTAVVAASAGDARRRVTLIERRGAAADHPAVLTIPETEYLKCLICRVD